MEKRTQKLSTIKSTLHNSEEPTDIKERHNWKQLKKKEYERILKEAEQYELSRTRCGDNDSEQW